MGLSFLSNSQNEAVILKVSYKEPESTELITDNLSSLLSAVPKDRAIIVVCVGTDRSTGDALGPLVGSQLKKTNNTSFYLFGTLEEPVHAMNLADTILQIERQFCDPFVIAIDACLGKAASIGHIQLGNGPVKPGAGVNKELPAVGNIHVTGIVNVGGFMEYFVLQNTRLNLVMEMAEVISSSIHSAIVRSKTVRITPI